MTSSKLVNLTQKKLIKNLTVQKYYQYTHIPTPAKKMKLINESKPPQKGMYYFFQVIFKGFFFKFIWLDCTITQ